MNKYNDNKPPYIQFRFFTAKVNEALQQVAYVNYALKEIKEVSQTLGEILFVENCIVKKVVFFMFFVW